MLEISNKLKEMYPDSRFGVLIMKNVKNPSSDLEFEKRKKEVLEHLKEKYKDYNRKDFIKTEPICHYIDYYKKFKKTYHVLLQLESIILKSKSIPSIASLVEAMFTAEVKNLLLTAGHDLDKMTLPLKVDLAFGNEVYTGISKKEMTVYKDDMILSDNDGIISSIISGPDERTKITKDTKNALFFIYGPNGVSEEAILNHLNDIQEYASIIAPESSVEFKSVQ